MSTPRYISANNPFLPVATGQIVSYVRDPKEFKVNEYVQQVRSPAPNANFLKLDRHAPARVTDDDEFAWNDGAKSPTGHFNLANFKWEPFTTQRRAFPFSIGNQAIAAANKFGGWDPAAVHAAIVAQQAITARTKRILDLLQTSGNWSGNTATAGTLNSGAGYWDLSSSVETDSNFLAIAKSLMEALRLINLGTNAKVQPKDLVLLLSPTQAMRLANSGEIHSYMKGSRYSLPWLMRSSDSMAGVQVGNPNEQWYLPAYIAGVKIVVEDAVIVTSMPYAGDSTEPTVDSDRAYIKNDSDAILVTRKGGLDAPFGGPNYSTVQCYWYSERGQDGGELEIEVRSDDWHRMTEGRCVEQYKEVLAAAPTGYLIRDILS